MMRIDGFARVAVVSETTMGPDGPYPGNGIH
jgi:hypothetical protein